MQTIRSKYKIYVILLIGLVINVFLTSCDETVPLTYPDYTGEKGIVYDIEGNKYKTIGIGSQIWMAENLRTSLLNDSSSILDNCSHIISMHNDTGYVNVLTTGYCWYNNIDDTTKNHFGALYNYYAVETEKLCPKGWHVPSEEEWNTLTEYLGGNSVAGSKLKGSGFRYWDMPNEGATNESGFNALPGGRRYSSHNIFCEIRKFGYWWSTPSIDMATAFAKYLSSDNAGIHNREFLKSTACSIRCIKN